MKLSVMALAMLPLSSSNNCQYSCLKYVTASLTKTEESEGEDGHDDEVEPV